MALKIFLRPRKWCPTRRAQAISRRRRICTRVITACRFVRQHQGTPRPSAAPVPRLGGQAAGTSACSAWSRCVAGLCRNDNGYRSAAFFRVHPIDIVPDENYLSRRFFSFALAEGVSAFEVIFRFNFSTLTPADNLNAQIHPKRKRRPRVRARRKASAVDFLEFAFPLISDIIFSQREVGNGPIATKFCDASKRRLVL